MWPTHTWEEAYTPCAPFSYSSSETAVLSPWGTRQISREGMSITSARKARMAMPWLTTATVSPSWAAAISVSAARTRRFWSA